jgi:pimeloyl-ACP methyl ester carboxylesterase
MITVSVPSTIGGGGHPGPSLPPVLLIHGAASSFQHNWGASGWLDLLADEHRTVLGYELPGHGEQASYAPEHGDEIVTQLLAALGDYEQVDAVGFSAGAQLLTATAAREPSRFRRIAVLGVGDKLMHADPTGPVKLGEMLADESRTDLQARLFRQIARSAGNDPLAIARYLQIPRPALSPQIVSRITCPALVLLGERDFAMPADELAATLPQGELKVLRRADHFGLTLDVSAMDAVLSFLALP